MFARYMWVLKFYSNWCALLLHHSHNTTKVLEINRGPECSLFPLRFFICLITCENELQLALMFILQFLCVVLCFHVGLFVVYYIIYSANTIWYSIL